MQQLIRIVAAVVDTKKAIFYKEDGSSVEILQGDPRLRPLLEKATPQLIQYGYADVDLSTENHYKAFEEASGSVRFFKIAKEKLKKLFSRETEPVHPTVVGTVPSPQATVDRMQAAMDEIMKHATWVTSDSFEEGGVASQRPTVESNGRTPNDQLNDGRDGYFDKHKDTIVAITKTGGIVPGVERIKSQFAGAVKNGNTKGMEVFLQRLSKVIKQRSHTVEDLLRFMERGDLPVANDGTIIIYKKLYRQDGHYVDPYTKRVMQKVGSYVYMDQKLVDPDRRNECSNGLHVARRGYIRTFSGDVIVLAKVRPEDVIAVPDYDANKMRVCGYHILFELTAAQFQAINSNRPISDAEDGAELLGRAIAGDHVGILEHVKIGANNGRNLKITPKKQAASKPVKGKQTKAGLTPKAKAVKPLETVHKASDKAVDVKKVVAKTKDASASLSEEEAKPLTQTDVVKALWDKALSGNTQAANELLTFKKTAKKGWAVWGLPTTAGDTLKALINPE